MVKVVTQVSKEKRRRFNKNKKKAWRKKANIADVEAALEEDRREERYGGPLEEKKDMELLFVDTGEEKAPEAITAAPLPPHTGVSGNASKPSGLKPSKKKPMKTLTSHQFLNGLPGVKPPRKPRAKETKEKEVCLTKSMKKKNKLKDRIPKFGKMAQQKVIEAVRQRGKTNHIHKIPITTDIWDNTEDQKLSQEDVDVSFLPAILDHYTHYTKQAPIKVPKTSRLLTSTLPSIQLPQEGESYNPSFEAHQSQMWKAVKQQHLVQQELKSVERATTRKFPTVDDAPTEETWLTEMSEGLPTAEAEADDTDHLQAQKKVGEDMTVTNKVTTERKTKRQRKKEKNLKLKTLKRNQKKEARIRDNEIYRVKTIIKELDMEEILKEKRQESRLKQRIHRMSKPGRLGKLKFQDDDVPVLLGDELPDSLRTLTPNYSVMQERFRNYQRRNMMETRLPLKRQKNLRAKKVVKRSYKEAMAKIEAIDLS